jgi:endonuclease/exonuclease/phosphatase family metal-dependent hydrolase
MPSTLKYLAVLALALTQACAEDALPTAPALENEAAIMEHGGRRGGSQGITVMTQNLYVGADVDAVIGALATPDPDDDIPALLAAVATVEATDFPARARAIARQVKQRRPAVIGLQEVSTIGVDIPPLGVSLHLDFQQILLDALAAEGLEYVVAVRLDNFTAAPAPGASLTDAEVMLVDPRRVEVVSSAGHTFQANLGVVAPGVDLQRGWITMEAIIGGQPYTFVSTHTEGTGPQELLLQLHALQVGEMVASLGSASPVIAMGDFNTQPGTPAYQAMRDAGFTDVWSALRPGVQGLTCCHLADLSNPGPVLTKRIDYVWTRGLGDARGLNPLQGRVSRYGDVPSDRILNAAGRPIWPADHAGLIADLLRGLAQQP